MSTPYRPASRRKGSWARPRRLFALLLGLVVTIAPRRIVDAAERLAFENPGTARLRPWTLPIARLEGVIGLWLLGRRPESASALRTPLAVLGLVLSLIPRTALAFGLRLAYENSGDLEVNRWVVPVTRLVGACYLAAGLFAERVANFADDADGRR